MHRPLPSFTASTVNRSGEGRQTRFARRQQGSPRISRQLLESLESRVLLDGLPTWSGYAGDPQHSAVSPVASQPLQTIAWSRPVDLQPQFSGSALLVHYGSPVITAANTVIIPVKTGATGQFELEAVDGGTGALKWTVSTDYILPDSSWTQPYAPALTPQNRLYYAGAGGTLYFMDSPDLPGQAVHQVAFFGDAVYAAHGAEFDSGVEICTPLTSDAAGNIYFGFRVNGDLPDAPALTSGIARIAPDGSASYVPVAGMGDALISQVAMNCAPAISPDGKTVYITVDTGGSSFARGYLVALDAATLQFKAAAALNDPQTGTPAVVAEIGTASPTVGPDGDVYIGVLESNFPAHNDRGWLLHFSSDLSVQKTPGSFGWDDTVSIVPASMVPSYSGSSGYLLMAKYNNYAGLGTGDGVNKLAILDPNAGMTDPYSGVTVMNGVETITGPTSEGSAQFPDAVREWCINTAAVDPATDSILANSEDGRLYRWNLASNTFTESITLTAGLGEAYTPTLIGADGRVYAINDATLFSVGMASGPMLVDGSFEGLSAKGYTYNPGGGAWTFSGSSGIQSNGSAWGAPVAPDGKQTAFLQSGGSGQISQLMTLQAGTYSVQFKAALRGYRSGIDVDQQIGVYMDGALLGIAKPGSARAWDSFNYLVTVGAGSHTLSFQAMVAGGDTSAFLDDVRLAAAAPDDVPPVISGVAASDVTAASASISWNTDEPADSQVEYGTSSTYGYTTVLDSGPVTGHAAGISGLEAGTVYHYRVGSSDGSGNVSYSGDYTFTTSLPSAALINGSFEAVSANSYTYNPVNAGWNFTGSSGIQSNGSAWGAAAAPDGTQTAFLQSDNPGRIDQVLTLQGGTYTVQFRAALRGYRSGSNEDQQIGVFVDGTLLGIAKPGSSSSWDSFSYSTTVGAGSHTLSFQAMVNGGDTSAFLDDIQLTSSGPVDPGDQAPTVAAAASSGVSNVIGTSTTLSVLGADDGGESGLTYTWSAISAPNGAALTFASNGLNSAKNDTVTFDRAGNYTLQVVISDGTLNTASQVSLVVTQTPTNLSITPGTVTLLGAGMQQFGAVVTDQFGRTMAFSGVNWSVVAGGDGSITSGGLFTAGTIAGTATVRANLASLTGTAEVTVMASPPQTGSLLADGSFEGLSAHGYTYNPGGGAWTFSGYAGIQSNGSAWGAPVAPDGMQTAFLQSSNPGHISQAVTLEAGTYSVEFKSALRGYRSGSNADQQIGVYMDGTLLGIAQPGSSSSWDSFSYSTTVGAGSHTLSFQAMISSGDTSAFLDDVQLTSTGPITPVNQAPTVARAASSGVSNVIGTSTTLSVLGADDGGESGLTYTWSLVSGPANPIFSVNGSNAAKNTAVTFGRAGGYSFQVTISDGSLMATSEVSLVVSQTATGLSVTPGTVTLSGAGTQQFAAVVTDQFGQAMPPSGIAWGVDAGGDGSITSSGLFTAGTSAGTATVRATLGSLIATAAVTVTPPTTLRNGSFEQSPANGYVYNPNGAVWTFTGNSGIQSNGSAWGAPAATDGAQTAFLQSGNPGQISQLVTLQAGLYSVQFDAALRAYRSGGAVNQQIGVYMDGTLLGIAQPRSTSAWDSFTFPAAVGDGSHNLSFQTMVSAGDTSAFLDDVRLTFTGPVNQAPTVARAAFSGVSNVTGTITTLSVLGADDGGESGLTYTWSAISAPEGATPVFKSNGLNSSKSNTVTFDRSGNYTFEVVISDGTLNATSQVSLVVTRTATQVQVAPSLAVVAVNGSQQFAATVNDQFGQPMPGIGVTWSINPGDNGTIDANGLFTASSLAGTTTVTATAGLLHGSSNVTVVIPATIATRAMTSFTELAVTGTSGNDSIFISQSGNTFTIVSNGCTQTITGNFGDLIVHAGNGGSTITVDSSVTINTILYGGAGNDTLTNSAQASYNAIVSIGGGNDTDTGNLVNTCYWSDQSTADTVNASNAEIIARRVHQVSQFYQPWSTDPADPNYISKELLGQNLADPADAGTTTRISNASLWGTGPVMADINQGQIGDCYLLAPLASLAFSNPGRLMNQAVDLGDGTYVVQFFQSGASATYVRVDGDLSLVFQHPGASGDIWGSIIEKAFAFFRTKQNSYASLDTGFTAQTFQQLGFNVSVIDSTQTASTVASLVAARLAAGNALAVDTPSTIVGGAPLIASHSYSVIGVTTDASGNIWYTLRNPWGFDGAGSDANPNDGIITIPSAQLSANSPIIYSA